MGIMASMGSGFLYFPHICVPIDGKVQRDEEETQIESAHEGPDDTGPHWSAHWNVLRPSQSPQKNVTGDRKDNWDSW